MPQTQYPYLRVECYPLTSVPLNKGRGWTVADVVAKTLRGGSQEGSGLNADDAYPTAMAMRALAASGKDGYFSDVQNLDFRRVHDDVDGTEVSGFAVHSRWVPRNSFMADAGGVPDDVAYPSYRYRCVGWRPEPISLPSWRTCRTDESEHTGITWHDARADQAFSARTLYPLPGAQGFALRLKTWAPAASRTAKDSPFVMASWANGQWAVSARPRSAPCLLRKDGNGYQVAREFPQVPGLFEGEDVWLHVEYLAGRMVTSLTGPGGGHQVAYSRRPLDAQGDPQAILRPFRDPSGGVLRIAGQGCACVAETYEQRHWEMSPSDRLYHRVGSFSREYWAPVSPMYANGGMATGMEAIALGYPAENRPGYTGNSGRPAALPAEMAVFTDVPVRGNRRRYTCQVQSEFRYAKGGAVGHDDGTPWHVGVGSRNPVGTGDWANVYHNDWWQSQTPLVHTVAVSYRSKYVVADADTPLDIRPAIASATHQSGDPGISPTRSFSADVHLDLLPECSLVGGTTPIGDLWPHYVGKHKGLAAYASWQNDDKSIQTWWSKGDIDVDEVLVLAGYQTGWAPSLQRYGEGRGRLEASDPSVRLQKPAGVIDGAYSPLDFILMRKVRDLGGRQELHGWEAVQYIIETTLGPQAVVYRAYPPGWHGLLEYEMLTNPPQGNGFLWAPPFNSDALSWIRQICEKDFAVFFMDRYYDAGVFRYLPHYGNYFRWIANAPSYTLSDVVSVLPWDYNAAMMGIDASERGELDINRMQVWGRIPGDNDPTGGGLWPARPGLVGEARIEHSSVEGQGVDESWVRTKVVEGSHFYWPGVAQCVADWVMWAVSDTRMRSATVRLRGQPGIGWGDKITLNMANPRSQDEMELNGHSFRIAKLTDEWQFGQTAEYTTTVVCSPLKAMPAAYTGGLHLLAAGGYYDNNGNPV